MGHYLLNFSVYTIAMIGLIMLALFVYKTCMSEGKSKKSSMLNVVDSMRLSPRKTLYVIKVGEEKYLIAADIESTSLIAKLDNNATEIPIKQMIAQSESQQIRKDKTPQEKGFDESACAKYFTTFVDFKPKSPKKPMMKQLMKKLKK